MAHSVIAAVHAREMARAAKDADEAKRQSEIDKHSNRVAGMMGGS